MQRKIVCPVTQKPAKFYCRKGSANYYIEKASGIIFQGNLPETDEMASYADEEYENGLYAGYVAASNLKILTFEKRIGKIEKLAKGKKLLDIGCSCGFFLEVALNHQFDAYGVEFSKAAISYAKPHVQERITCGDVNALSAGVKTSFDVITGFDIIEHTKNPAELIDQVWQTLAPGGVVVLSTPDTGHWLRYIMGSRWPMLQPMQHTVLLSRKAMHGLLTKAGFRDIQIETSRKVLTPDYLLSQIKDFNPSIFKVCTALLRLIPSRYRNKPIAINIGEFIAFARKPEKHD